MTSFEINLYVLIPIVIVRPFETIEALSSFGIILSRVCLASEYIPSHSSKNNVICLVFVSCYEISIYRLNALDREFEVVFVW